MNAETVNLAHTIKNNPSLFLRSITNSTQMPIPPLDSYGLLPQGIFDCSFPEIQIMFCPNTHRQNLFDGLMNFLNTEWYPHGIAAPILIDGIFVREKLTPDDVDVVFDMTGHSDQSLVIAFGLWFRHDELKLLYNVDVWVRHPRIPNDLVSFFQYIGDKAAAELRLNPKHPKGILRIQP
ncbi:MAG: DUF6932 family protein [Gallionellaceae bacterium]|jgi:hypothetical protein